MFHELALPDNLPHVKAVTVADVMSEGTLALVAVEDTGALVAITSSGAEGWKVVGLGNAPRLAREVRLHAADLDNNGAMDLLITPVALDGGAPPALCCGSAVARRNSLCCLRRWVPSGFLTLQMSMAMEGSICWGSLLPGRHSRP